MLEIAASTCAGLDVTLGRVDLRAPEDLPKGPFDAVLSAGVAGALPGGDLEIGAPLVATSCVYAEEGLAGWIFEHRFARA